MGTPICRPTSNFCGRIPSPISAPLQLESTSRGCWTIRQDWRPNILPRRKPECVRARRRTNALGMLLAPAGCPTCGPDRCARRWRRTTRPDCRIDISAGGDSRAHPATGGNQPSSQSLAEGGTRCVAVELSRFGRRGIAGRAVTGSRPMGVAVKLDTTFQPHRNEGPLGSLAQRSDQVRRRNFLS
jgi:hypothetical protein